MVGAVGAVLGRGVGCSGTGSVVALEGVLNRLKGFEGGLGVAGVAGVGSSEADAKEGRRFGKRNPSGPGSRLDWLEASLSDLSGVVPELKVGSWKPQIYEERAEVEGAEPRSNCWLLKYKRITQPLTPTHVFPLPAKHPRRHPRPRFRSSNPQGREARSSETSPYKPQGCRIQAQR